jgi:exodeoxyribonuclease-3
MQETKCKDEQFPHEAFRDAGYEVAHHGFSQWNGVAIASRVGLADVEVGFPGQPGFSKTAGVSLTSANAAGASTSGAGTSTSDAGATASPNDGGAFASTSDAGASASTSGAATDDPPVVEARALGATCGGVRVWSLYIPNGRALDDPHYTYKLAWLDALRDTAADWLRTDPQAQIALLGDWNVVPLDTDVWDMAPFDGATHVSPPERAAFAAFGPASPGAPAPATAPGGTASLAAPAPATAPGGTTAGAGYREVTREHLPAPHTYTYWDYKALAFPKDFGMRIDFAWATPALAERVTSVVIDRDERKGKGASDHVPVILTLPA